METVQTNMVLCDILDTRWDAAGLTGALREAGVLCNAVAGRRVRLVTHKDVSSADVLEALGRIEQVLRAGPGADRGRWCTGDQTMAGGAAPRWAVCFPFTGVFVLFLPLSAPMPDALQGRSQGWVWRR